MDYAARIESLEERFKEHKREYTEILRRLNNKDIADAVLREQLDTVVKTTARIEAKLDEQKAVPMKRWETVVTTIISTVVGGIFVAVLSLIIR